MDDRDPPLHYTSAVYLVLRESREPLPCVVIHRRVLNRYPHLHANNLLFGEIERFLQTYSCSLFHSFVIGNLSNAVSYALNSEYDHITIDQTTGQLNGFGRGTGAVPDLMDLRL